MKPKDIHKIANKMEISWDGNTEFMSWCKKIVGKKHLDDMDETELITIYNNIKNDMYIKPSKNMNENKKSYDVSWLSMFEQQIEEIKSTLNKMTEDVFGHRVTTWTPKDTAKLKKKLSEPITDKEREDHVRAVEPRMDKKSVAPKQKDKKLDSFIDLDTRISQKDYEPTIDLDTYKKVRIPLKFKSTDEKGADEEGSGGEKEKSPK
jgi:hypothetical protein